MDQEGSDGTVKPGRWRDNGQGNQLRGGYANNTTHEAQQIRDMYAEYFVGAGRVEWQDRIVNRGFN